MAHPYSNLTAANVMQSDIVSVEVEDSLQTALNLMTENHVSGLPVIDGDKRCLGVVSAFDILNYEQEHIREPGDESEDTAQYYDPEAGAWEDIRVSAFALEQRGSTPVGEIMTRDVVSVAPETPLPRVAASMIENDVHRVLVLDDEKTLLGLISAVDFVQLVADEAG